MSEKLKSAFLAKLTFFKRAFKKCYYASISLSAPVIIPNFGLAF